MSIGKSSPLLLGMALEPLEQDECHVGGQSILTEFPATAKGWAPPTCPLVSRLGTRAGSPWRRLSRRSAANA